MEDVATLRREKIIAIIADTHEQLQSVMIACGLDPAIARMAASSQIWSMYYAALPEEFQQGLDTIKLSAQEQLNELIPALLAASTKAELNRAYPDDVLSEK